MKITPEVDYIIKRLERLLSNRMVTGDTASGIHRAISEIYYLIDDSNDTGNAETNIDKQRTDYETRRTTFYLRTT